MEDAGERRSKRKRTPSTRYAGFETGAAADAALDGFDSEQEASDERAPPAQRAAAPAASASASSEPEAPPPAARARAPRRAAAAAAAAAAPARARKKHPTAGELRSQRQARLVEALAARGLPLRDDSRLCEAYIWRGEGDVDTIVDVMDEMRFYHEHTLYSDFCEDHIRDARRHKGYYDSQEVSENAKEDALANWVCKYPSNASAARQPQLPATLREAALRVSRRDPPEPRGGLSDSEGSEGGGCWWRRYDDRGEPRW